jgi:hypothetical protein
VTAAERQCEYRRRRRDGLIVLPIAVDVARLETMLMALHKIDRERADDRNVLAAAVETLIADMIEAYERDA